VYSESEKNHSLSEKDSFTKSEFYLSPMRFNAKEGSGFNFGHYEISPVSSYLSSFEMDKQLLPEKRLVT
jgi:hypothetical protein